jgi:DNA-binding LacI/PurR family transcriptional regulator
VLLGSQVTLANPMGFIGAFLDELAAHGIDAGQYNAPGWEGGYDGLYQRLESLFTSTPPTAIILFSTEHYFATIQFLINRGLRMPQDISLACMQKSPHFQRFQPPISHANWNDQLIVRRIVRWAKNISQGKEDIRQTRIDSEFIEAGTVGPAPE